VEALGEWYFNYSKLEVGAFEAGSRLKRIEEKCFRECQLKPVSIPAPVTFLVEDAFEPFVTTVRAGQSRG